VLILTQQIVVKDLEFWETCEKGWFIRLYGGVLMKRREGAGLKGKEGLRNGVERADGHDM